MGQANQKMNTQGFNVTVYVDSNSEDEARKVKAALQRMADDFGAKGILELASFSQKTSSKMFLRRFKKK